MVLNTFQKYLNKKIVPKFNVFFCKNNKKTGSFVACWIFSPSFLKNFSLHKNEQSTSFFVNFIGIIFFKVTKAKKKKNNNLVTPCTSPPHSIWNFVWVKVKFKQMYLNSSRKYTIWAFWVFCKTIRLATCYPWNILVVE